MSFRPQRTASGRFQSFLMESLEARQLLSATLSQPITNVSFAQDSGPESVDLYALFADTNGNADLQFTATSSATAVVTTSILGNKLTLNPTAGRSGFSIVKMVASDPNGGRAVNTFRVQITALPARSLDVTLDAKHRSVQFVQTDHASATISLTGPGTAVVHFGGDGLKLSGAVLQGSHVEMESVTLSNTTGKSHLTIIGARSGSAQAIIGNIVVSNSLGTLDVHKSLLIGDITATNAINSVNFDAAQNGVITIGSGAMRLTVGSALDETFSSAGSVSFLQATQWIDSDEVADTFSAVAIHGMLVKGNFMPSVDVSGTGVKGRSLDNVRVRGGINGSWSVHGPTGSIDVGSLSLGWEGRFDTVANITTDGGFIGFLSAESVHQIKTRGSIGTATIELFGKGTSLGSLSALSVDGLSLYTNGNIGSITTQFLFYTTIYAGLSSLPNGVLPSSVSEFTTNARIGSIRLNTPARNTGFAGSQIAAARIGNFSLSTTATKNSKVTYGIAAESIDSLTMRDKSRPQTFSLHKIKTDAALQALIKARKWVLGDLSLRIL